MRDMDQLSKIECSIKRGKWAEVLKALKLSDTQREQLMANRKEHLNKLRRIFQERQELNMQVSLLQNTLATCFVCPTSHF